MKKSGLADSPFFQPPSASIQVNQDAAQESSHNPAEVRSNDRTENRSESRAENRLTLPHRRSSRRSSFEFYDDQLERLKRLQAQALLKGERLNLSAVVREALDRYFHDLEL